MRSTLRLTPSVIPLFPLFASLLLCITFGAEAKTVLEAEQLKVTGERTVARGEVTAKNNDWEINSDYLELEEGDGGRSVFARGNVSLTYSDWTISCAGLRLQGANGEEKIAVTGGVVLEGPDWDLTAGSLELTGGGESEELVAGEGVTLDGGKWTMSSDTLNVKTGGEGEDVTASGDVKLSAGDFQAEGEDLRGKVLTDSESETLTGSLSESQGRTDSLEFQGGETTFTLSEGKLQRVELATDARLVINSGAEVTGDIVSLEALDNGWGLKVEGNSTYIREDTTIEAKGITGEVVEGAEGEFGLMEASADSLRGELKLELEDGAEKVMRVFGGNGTFDFDEEGEVTRADLDGGTVSTCEGPKEATGCAYSISADRTSLIDREIVLADSALLRSFGLPVGWSPLYFLSLKDVGLPQRNYFPRLGFSEADGILISGAVPVYVDRNNFGNVVFDYFSRNQGAGVGLDYYSGKGVLPGVAQVYGAYRVFGDNYFKLEADLSSEVNDWLEFDAGVDYNQGTFRGTTYDRNEWALNLSSSGLSPSWGAKVSREESITTDESGQTADHTVERLPELDFSWTISPEGIPGEYEVGSNLGYYREKLSTWSEARYAGRATFTGNFSVDSSPIRGLRVSLSGEGETGYYLAADGENSRPRAWEEVVPSLELTGPATLRTEFVHRGKVGSSPFYFDHVDRLNRLKLDLSSSQGEVTQTLDFYYDFLPDPGPSDITYKVNFDLEKLDQTLSFAYDPALGWPESLGTESIYSTKDLGVKLSTGYDFSDLSMSESSLGLRLGSGVNDFTITLKGTPLDTWLEVVSGELKLKLFETWSINIAGEYDLSSDSLTGLSYSVHNTLQNCLKVGISGNESGVWFDVELAGF